MLEHRPRLKNHLLALATVTGIVLAGAVGFDFLLTGGMQWPASAEADDQPVVVYAGDTDAYWEQPTSPPPSLQAGFFEIGYDAGAGEDELVGAPNGERAVQHSFSEDALYREIEALYARQDDRAAVQDASAYEADEIEDEPDVYDEQMDAQAQALGDYAFKDKPSDIASPS